MTETDPLKIGDSEAEVCFVGRSNAGKSTLINALCAQTDMARVSQVPGKTRTINVYEVKPCRWMVDLPGYGYAVGSKTEKGRLGPMIEAYLGSRTDLKMVVVVLDAHTGPTKLDILMINWLRYNAYPLSLVVNKIDQVVIQKQDARKEEIALQLSVMAADIFWISARKNIGIAPLQSAIARWLDLVVRPGIITSHEGGIGAVNQ
jgi:GTP-binding protein